MECGIDYPIYKNKGKDTDPDNYRGITLLSCLGKFVYLYPIIKRLSQFLENDRLLGDGQAGFRSGYSTSDRVFVLKAFIDIICKIRKYYIVLLLIIRKLFI